jgi:hypothetical protein
MFLLEAFSWGLMHFLTIWIPLPMALILIGATKQGAEAAFMPGKGKVDGGEKLVCVLPHASRRVEVIHLVRTNEVAVAFEPLKLACFQKGLMWKW